MLLTNRQFRPMLAATIEDIQKLQYPLLASYKLDGVRAIVLKGKLISRTLKPLPNVLLQAKITADLEGYDGEIIAGSPTADDCYRKTISATMSDVHAIQGVKYHIFDDITYLDMNYSERRSRQVAATLPSWCESVTQHWVGDADVLTFYEEQAIALGYEGLILRDPVGRYKFGRSTLKEGILLKLKRFLDAEATVVNFEERMHNANKATIDARGYTKRSSHQDKEIPTNSLGAIIVNWQGQELSIGTGFTEADRQSIWENRDRYLGWEVKFKYFPVGMKDLPRHPVFLGWRYPTDKEAK